MRTDEFRTWLEHSYRTPRDGRLATRSITRLVSTVQRVEQGLGNLDEHWRRDRAHDAMARLTFKRADAEYGRSPRHGIPIEGDPLTGTASLKRAAAIYFEFRRTRP